MNTILFDIGNVLTSDFWEALWLSPRHGLADRLKVPLPLATEVGSRLWSHYSVTMANERDYWLEFERLIGFRIPGDVIRECEITNIKVNKCAKGVILSLVRRGFHVGVISNNTSFWAPKQLALAKLDAIIENRLRFISADAQSDKTKTSPNLFEFACQYVSPEKTLVVDDRAGNISAANSLGFYTFLYGESSGAGLQTDGYYTSNDFKNLELVPQLGEARP